MNELEDEEEETGKGIAYTENSELDRLYDEFNDRFPIDSLKSMTLQEYTNLKEVNNDYFCTWVERKVQQLGSIQGATSLKFGIYRYNQDPKQDCKKDDLYAWRSDLGDSHEEAFENVRNKIVQVAEAASADVIDYKTIDDCNLSTMFKWKIAFLYSKKRLLSVYSKESLRFIAQEKGMELSNGDPISKIQQYLLNCQDCENRWDYAKRLWEQWDNRCTEAYNDFPVDRWQSLFKEKNVFKPDNIGILKKFLDFGGEATCSQLAQKYGESADYYREKCIKLADRIANRLALTLEQTSKSKGTLWKILFDGREVDSSSDIPGGFIWALKPNLKTALAQYLANGGNRRYFVAKITDAPNIFNESVKHNHWRMQQRYDHEEHKNAVTANLSNAMQVRKGDVLLLDNGGAYYAYGVVKEHPQNFVTECSLGDAIKKHKHSYSDNDGFICFSDCEAYYEQNYPGCNFDWSQYIDVEKWESFCPNNPVSNQGVMNAAGLAVHSIFEVSADWANGKIKELDEHFEMSKTEADKMMEENIKLLENKKNIILQGAPGTGKTYTTASLALSMIGKLPPCGAETDKAYHKKVMEEYEKQLIQFDDDGNVTNGGQIGFVTFHQSMDYEDFVEGIKPKTKNGSVSYSVEDGIFKAIRELANSNYEDCQKSKEELKSEADTKTVFERYCAQIEADLLENDGLELMPKSIMKIRGVYRKSDGSAKSISIAKAADSPVQTLSIDMILRDYQNFKKGVIKSYEDIKPKYESKSTYHGNAIYYFELFKKMLAFEKANKISSQTEKVELKNYVLIIDEINRGNVSKIFGELISLLEADKRAGGDHPLTVTLPYSKEQFSVPSNLYIIGTMNTTDRSVGSIDYAVRRRFAFVTLKAEKSAIESYYMDNAELEEIAVAKFDDVEKFLKDPNVVAPDVDFDDLMVGHSYFMAKTLEELKLKWEYEVIPLLKEYKKDGLLRRSAPIAEIENFDSHFPKETVSTSSAKDDE
ncbi:MAG: AAA family ATPase [Fibrobacter sp.]|nr:AAA family ATPase [Fibrobacter sp.]